MHCEKVYRKEDEKNKEEEEKEGEMWIGCDYCDNFSHFECERKAEDSKTILGMDAYACPECRMKVVLACAGEEGKALPKFVEVKDAAKKTLGDPRKTRTTSGNGNGDKSEKKTGMKTIGKRVIHQRPFLRTPRGAGNGGNKKGVEKNIVGLLENGAGESSPGIKKKNPPTKRKMTLSVNKDEKKREEKKEERILTKTPPKKKGAKKSAQKVTKKVWTPKKTKEAFSLKKKSAIERSLASLDTPRKKKKSKVAAAAVERVGEEQDDFAFVDDFDDSDAFALWSMKPTAPSTKTVLALQRAKQFLADEHIPLDAIKKHDSSLLGDLEDVFGDRRLLAAEHEEGSRESCTKVSTTAAIATAEATTATIPIFDEIFPSTENRPQDKVMASVEKTLKSARDCLENAVDDHWALVKQQKDNDERNQLQDHRFLTINTRQNTQHHAFKPILNAKVALQKISSLPTLKKSLGTSSIKAKNAIVERSKIKETLGNILQTFGNGREILESLSKFGGFWTTLATTFLNEIHQPQAASASMMMASVNPSESLSVQGGPFATDLTKRAAAEAAAAAAAMKEMGKNKDIVSYEDDITIVSPLPLKINRPVPDKAKRPRLYPTGGGGFISNGVGQMVPRMRTTASKHDSLFPPVPEMFSGEIYEDGSQPKNVVAPDASWGSPLRELYFDMVVNEGEQPNVSGEDIE